MTAIKEWTCERLQREAEERGWKGTTADIGERRLLTLDTSRWRIVCHFTWASRADGDHTVLNMAELFFGYEHDKQQGLIGYQLENEVERLLAWVDNPHIA